MRRWKNEAICYQPSAVSFPKGMLRDRLSVIGFLKSNPTPALPANGEGAFSLHSLRHCGDFLVWEPQTTQRKKITLNPALSEQSINQRFNFMMKNRQDYERPFDFANNGSV
jgi:hypothetical protein